MSRTPQEQWAEERGAIEQEVSRDLSNPTYKFITRLNEDLFSGTPYAHDALGTKASFDATTGAMLKKFYQDWYAPNNAILVIAGDVDPAATLARVKQLYGPIKRRPIPAHPEINLPPVKADSFTLDSNLPYELVFVAFRMPGTSSPDFAAARILGDVIGSQRADLYGLVPLGKALGTEFGLAETYPKASVGFCACRLAGRSRPGAHYRRDEDHPRGLRGQGCAGGVGGGGQEERNRGRRVSAELHPGSGGKLVAGAGRRRPRIAGGHCRGDEEGHGGRCKPGGEDLSVRARARSLRR